jgi:hypothetical protein
VLYQPVRTGEIEHIRVGRRILASQVSREKGLARRDSPALGIAPDDSEPRDSDVLTGLIIYPRREVNRVRGRIRTTVAYSDLSYADALSFIKLSLRSLGWTSA